MLDLDDQKRWIRACFRLAEVSSMKGKLPFGAILLSPDGVISVAENTVESGQRIGFHAEINALQQAGPAVRDLCNATLYCSTEPCRNCALEIARTGVGRLAFGCTYAGLQALLGVPSEFDCRTLLGSTKVDGPLLESEGLAVLARHSFRFDPHRASGSRSLGPYELQWMHGYRNNSSFWGIEPSSLLKFCPSPNVGGEIAVDLGCGQCRNAFALAAKGYFVFAVDVMPDAFRGLERGEWPIVFVCEDAYAFLSAQKTACLGLILANHVIQHCRSLDHVAALLKEAERTLKKDGTLALAYFTKPSDVHPWYVSAYALLPERWQIRDLLLDMGSFECVHHFWAIADDNHGEGAHKHAVEKLVLRKVRD